MTEHTKQGIVQFISQAWLIILLGLIFGTALAAVEIMLKPRILENKRQKMLNEIPKLFSTISHPEVEEKEVSLPNGKTAKLLKITVDGKTSGWVIPGSGLGFADRIDLLIAVDAQADRILGISILKQSETPGLGDYITSEKQPFRQSWASGNLSTSSEVMVKKATENPDSRRNEVEAISGATISSESVTRIVNKTVVTIKPIIVKGVE
jgi:electron transport complex protein RnfG